MSRLRVVLCSAAAALLVFVASVVGFAPAAHAATYTPPATRSWVNLNAGWRFNKGDVSGAQNWGYNDSGWAVVNAPHTWNALDGQDGGNNYFRGVGWYRRHYVPPAQFAGKKLWLQFAGANTVADVWINGAYVGRHKGGFARFRFDVTSVLEIGQDNVIAVKVSNARDPDVPPLSGDFTFFGGIYRNVSLWATDALQVRLLDYAGPGVYLRQRSVTAASATVDVTTKLWNNSPRTRSVAVRTIITHANGTVVADAVSPPRTVAAAAGLQHTQTVTIANPRRWHGRADPYLYKAHVEIRDAASGTVTDAVTERLGLRTVSIDPNMGLLLNGTRVALHGVNRHQDLLGKGWALSDADHAKDFALMDEMGVNALRTAHYQQDQKVYNLADERGYLVWTEIPLVDVITNSTGFRVNAEQQLREMIRQNYNHPSIVFWGIGNEQRTSDSATNSLLATLANIVAAEDPDRYSAYAHHLSVTSALAGHTEMIGYNRYYGWYSGSYNEFGGFVDGVRKTQPLRLFSISEYGAGGSILQHQENPPKPVPDSNFHPEEYQSMLHEATWTQIQARPWLWGTFVWNMFDFAADQRSEGDTYGRNDKGLVTYDRSVRKDAFYWYKANWTSTPFVHITSRRHANRTAAQTTVKAYGTTDIAILRLNGMQVGGPQSADNHMFKWPVTLVPGANRVEVIGSHNGNTYSDVVTWTLHP